MGYMLGLVVSFMSFMLGVAGGYVLSMKYQYPELTNNLAGHILFFFSTTSFVLGFLITKLKKEAKFKPTTLGDVKPIPVSEIRSILDASIKRAGMQVRRGGS